MKRLLVLLPLLLLFLSTMALAAAPSLRHGVAYYPELWPEADIERDIAEMKRLGLDTVRIGEFAWSRMEPEEGRVSLAFFRNVMDRMQAAGIAVVLCTPTATPPVWLTDGHPERCHVDGSGETMIHGARQHASYEHPAVRAACLRIVEAMARELGRHPALVAWQIDNEFKCHVAEDFNPAAVAHWREWLARRYGTIDRLNEAWGTEIWSQRYLGFAQVPAPLKTPFLHNASLSTAWLTFSREAIAEFMDAQTAVIRRHSAAPVTHNMNLGFGVDFERMSRDLDFVSFDDYPAVAGARQMVVNCDLFRAARPGRPFWVMETSPAHNGWLGNHETAHPAGFLAAEAVACYALGAEAFNYWLWRQQRTGCELPHSAVMSAWFKPGIGYDEVRRVEAARRALAPLLAATRVAPAEAAVTWSDRGRAMLQTEALGGNRTHRVAFKAAVSEWHGLLLEAGLHRDIRFEGASLDGLRLLVTPMMPAVTPEFAARIEAWVRSGGVWICAPVTGTRTAEHTVPTDAGLGLVDRLGGVETVFSFPITGMGAAGEAFGTTAPLVGWCSALRAAGAETHAVGALRGLPQCDGLAFLTERRLGQGLVVVLGAQPGDEAGRQLLSRMVAHYAERAGIKGRFASAPGIVVVPRVDSAGRPSWIAVNLTASPGGLTLPAEGIDAVNGSVLPPGTLSLPGFEWRAVRW